MGSPGAINPGDMGSPQTPARSLDFGNHLAGGGPLEKFGTEPPEHRRDKAVSRDGQHPGRDGSTRKVPADFVEPLGCADDFVGGGHRDPLLSKRPRNRRYGPIRCQSTSAVFLGSDTRIVRASAGDII